MTAAGAFEAPHQSEGLDMFIVKASISSPQCEAENLVAVLSSASLTLGQNDEFVREVP